MARLSKGSRPQDKIVGISEAAKMLGVAESAVQSLVKKGVLIPTEIRRGRQKFFSIHDLSALAEVLKSKTSLADLAMIAMQAHVRSRRVERRIDELFCLMGWYRVPLGLTEEEIVLLFTRVSDVLETSPALSASDVREWAEILFSIDEGYLALVGKHTASDEPWKTFMDLGQKLSSEAPRASFPGEPDLHFAYAYLETAREHLRNAAYLYCRHHLGARQANEVFRDGKTSPTEAIIQLLFPH